MRTTGAVSRSASRGAARSITAGSCVMKVLKAPWAPGLKGEIRKEARPLNYSKELRSRVTRRRNEPVQQLLMEIITKLESTRARTLPYFELSEEKLHRTYAPGK